MSLIVFTGGARSGKSSAAEKLAQKRAADGMSVTVVAFGRGHEADAEFVARIERHRRDRPATFRTLEAADSLGWRDDVPADGVLLLDCLGTLLGRAMEEAWEESAAGDPLLDAAADTLPEGFEADVSQRLEEAIVWLAGRRADTIVVTNEVGDGVVPAYATGRLFRDLLGRANRTLADVADGAYLVVAGRVLDLKALPAEASWPQD